MSTMTDGTDYYTFERAVTEAREAQAREERASRDSKALSCALCAGWHAVSSLDALLTHPSGLQPAEYTYIVRTAERLRAKLAEAERLETMQ